jgi:hypothetical protein
MKRYKIVRNISEYNATFDTYTVVEVNSRKSISCHDSKAEAYAAIQRLTTEKTK